MQADLLLENREWLIRAKGDLCTQTPARNFQNNDDGSDASFCLPSPSIHLSERLE